jgi:hypothetical protein
MLLEKDRHHSVTTCCKPRQHSSWPMTKDQWRIIQASGGLHGAN